MIFENNEIEELKKLNIYVDNREYSTDEVYKLLDFVKFGSDLYYKMWYFVFGPPTSIRWATPEQRKMWPPEIKKEDIVECPRCNGKLKILKDEDGKEYYKCETCKYVSYIIQAEKKNK